MCPLMNRYELDPDPCKVLAVSLELGISACDAQFVALSRQLGCRLASADTALNRRLTVTSVLAPD